MVAHPLDACEPLQPQPLAAAAASASTDVAADHCQAGEECPDASAAAGNRSAAGRWVLLAQRGGCSFVTKVAHGEAAGAVAVVIGNAPGTGNEVIEVPPAGPLPAAAELGHLNLSV